MNLDISKISGVEVEGIDMSDCPDFCDSYISSATYEGRDLTEEELDKLNENRDFVYEQTVKWIY